MKCLNLSKIAGLYSLFVGSSILLLWILLITTNQVPELNNSLLEILYHLIAEILTASFLLLSGFGLLSGKKWGFHTFLISLGLLFYTVIVSAGYYIQTEEYGIVIMFTTLQIITAAFIALSFLKWRTFQGKE
jgi:hypothetical protein